MAKKAIIILAEGFEEIEAISVIDILRRAGVEVTAAGLDGLKVTGSRGINILADKILDERDFEYDACILPGGAKGSSNLADSKKVSAIVQKMDSNGKLIAAICAAPAIVLAPMGILKNKSATCFPGMQDNFKKDTVYKNEAVVIDKNIITSQGPGTALQFSIAIAEKLVGKDTAVKVKKATLIS